MGGFHLINAKPELIQQTVAGIKAMNPEYIVPTHCTGFEAILAFLKEMPDKFILKHGRHKIHDCVINISAKLSAFLQG